MPSASASHCRVEPSASANNSRVTVAVGSKTGLHPPGGSPMHRTNSGEGRLSPVTPTVNCPKAENIPALRVSVVPTARPSGWPKAACPQMPMSGPLTEAHPQGFTSLRDMYLFGSVSPAHVPATTRCAAAK
jgi:hypothetical protein